MNSSVRTVSETMYASAASLPPLLLSARMRQRAWPTTSPVHTARTTAPTSNTAARMIMVVFLRCVSTRTS
jgi:hypothetical protein